MFLTVTVHFQSILYSVRSHTSNVFAWMYYYWIHYYTPPHRSMWHITVTGYQSDIIPYIIARQWWWKNELRYTVPTNLSVKQRIPSVTRRVTRLPTDWRSVLTVICHWGASKLLRAYYTEISSPSPYHININIIWTCSDKDVYKRSQELICRNTTDGISELRYFAKAYTIWNTVNSPVGSNVNRKLYNFYWENNEWKHHNNCCKKLIQLNLAQCCKIASRTETIVQ